MRLQCRIEIWALRGRWSNDKISDVAVNLVDFAPCAVHSNNKTNSDLDFGCHSMSTIHLNSHGSVHRINVYLTADSNTNYYFAKYLEHQND